MLLPLQANLCRLGCLPTGTFDYAVSMFSTLGMIRGRRRRRMALAEAFRHPPARRPAALHVHNLWLNLRNPQGRRWLARPDRPLALPCKTDLGDRRMTYRGIPRMEVHLYRWGELRRELRGAGLADRRGHPARRRLVPPDRPSLAAARAPRGGGGSCSRRSRDREMVGRAHARESGV